MDNNIKCRRSEGVHSKNEYREHIRDILVDKNDYFNAQRGVVENR